MHIRDVDALHQRLFLGSHHAPRDVEQGKLSSLPRTPTAGNTAMVRYFVNEVAQPNGDHEVHQFGCYYLELARRKRDIGEHDTCVTAVDTAKRFYPKANGCSYCSRPCHRG